MVCPSAVPRSLPCCSASVSGGTRSGPSFHSPGPAMRKRLSSPFLVTDCLLLGVLLGFAPFVTLHCPSCDELPGLSSSGNALRNGAFSRRLFKFSGFVFLLVVLYQVNLFCHFSSSSAVTGDCRSPAWTSLSSSWARSARKVICRLLECRLSPWACKKSDPTRIPREFSAIERSSVPIQSPMRRFALSVGCCVQSLRPSAHGKLCSSPNASTSAPLP